MKEACPEGMGPEAFTVENLDYSAASHSALLATSQYFMYTRSLVTESRTRYPPSIWLTMTNHLPASFCTFED